MEQEKRKAPLRCGLRATVEGRERFFGPGVYDLLRAIDALGSLSAACAQTGISYSKAWKGVRRMEQELGFAVLTRTNGGPHGGSSTLTPQGRRFLECYGQWMEEITQEAQRRFREAFSEFL